MFWAFQYQQANEYFTTNIAEHLDSLSAVNSVNLTLLD